MIYVDLFARFEYIYIFVSNMSTGMQSFLKRLSFLLNENEKSPNRIRLRVIFYNVWSVRLETLVNKSVITACRPIDLAIRLFNASKTPIFFFFGLGSKHPVSIHSHRCRSFSVYVPQTYRLSSLLLFVFFFFAHTSPWMHFMHHITKNTLHIKQKRWREIENAEEFK